MYRSMLILVILLTYMFNSAFSAAIPFTDTFYFVFMLLLSPIQILIYAIFYKDYGNEYYYRIFGHYKYNFSFTMVEPECIFGELLCLIFDWVVLYLPSELITNSNMVCLQGARIAGLPAYNVHQVFLLQTIYFFYFRNTNQQVVYSLYL